MKKNIKRILENNISIGKKEQWIKKTKKKVVKNLKKKKTKKKGKAHWKRKNIIMIFFQINKKKFWKKNEIKKNKID